MHLRSVWQQHPLPRIHPPEETDAIERRSDALVVGGGLCGLLTAYRLSERGVGSITVLEAEDFCTGTTAGTTGKITAQHGLLYHKLLSGMGRERAWLYARANYDAVEDYAMLAARLDADCEFTRCGAVVYTAQPDLRKRLEREADACLRLGLPVKLSAEAPELPFGVCGALRMAEQAHFHPLKFADALMRELRRRGVRLIPHTRVHPPEADGRAGEIPTSRGVFRADTVVMATRYPMLDKAMYFARLYQERSYLLALTDVPTMQDMYWGAGTGECTFRPFADGLLVGGAAHKTGHEGSRPHFGQLGQRSLQWYPDRRILACWAAQDTLTHDGIPYIGRYRQAEGLLAHRVYLATGFGKWGMTGSMVAAGLLADLVVGREHELADVVSPSRIDPGMKSKSFFVQTADMLAEYAGGYMEMAAESLRVRLSTGHDRAVPPKQAVSSSPVDIKNPTDRAGRPVRVTRPRCTHMGCLLNWNAEEQTWDCPCHGSRFDQQGRPLSPPAHKTLDVPDNHKSADG